MSATTGCTADQHDTPWAYRLGCRCPGGLAANSRCVKKWRLRKLRYGNRAFTVDATGARRRVHALVLAGHDLKWLAAHCDLNKAILSAVAHQYRTRINIDTHLKIAALYDELYAEDGPSKRAAMRAQRAGWVPAWAWTDHTIDDPRARPWQGTGLRRGSSTVINEVAVTAACNGQRVDTTIADRREIVRRLHADGLNDQQIARLTGISARTALRIRGQLQLPANERADRQEGAA